MATDALVLRRVNTFYGDSHVLHDLSLRVPAGRLVALLGRNGVGKTTCIHSIIGFVPPRSGDIELFGEPIAGCAPERIAARGVGLVAQGRRIFPTLTVTENLSVASRARSRGHWNAARVFELFPRLAERRNAPGGRLSGGEQQMLAMGRALMTNPRLLLLDEPCEGLSPVIVRELEKILLALKGEGLSILLVEQNIAVALRLADDAVILNSARTTYDGPAAELQSRPGFLNEQLGVY